MKPFIHILPVYLLILALFAVSDGFGQNNNGGPRHDHFFVEIDDVISDEGLKGAIINRNMSDGCLEPDANGMVEIPINLMVNLWRTHTSTPHTVSPAVEVQLTVREYTSGQALPIVFFYEPQELPYPIGPGTTIEYIHDFHYITPPISKVVGGDTYFKYSASIPIHLLSFSAQNSQVYELAFTLVNYPEDRTLPLVTHTQTFNLVIGECECDSFPISLTIPNPDPVPGEYARAQTFIHAAGTAGPIDIVPGQKQLYFGGTEIVLKDGFHAQEGSDFRTLLGPCVDFSSVYREQELPSELSFEIFPNPSNGNFQLKYQLPSSWREDHLDVRIVNNQGQTVKAFSVETKEQETLKVKLPELPSGLYFVILQTQNMQAIKALHKQ
ncbi:MAG: T9SS type A sorting domain-containing protein [Bacteroidota bacterium]